MGKDFSVFTNIYSISKTLRFELKPIAETLLNIKKEKLLESDEKKLKDYKSVKAIIDDYHKLFIDDVLKEASFEWNILEKKILECDRNNTDDSNLKKTQEELRKSIVKDFSKDERFKLLVATTPKDLFDDKDFKNWVEQTSQKNQDALQTFKNFSTFFIEFQKNRKNIYSDKAISTAVAYRIVHDNFPKFVQNIKIYRIIQEQCPQVIREVENELGSYLGNERLSDIFNAESYNKYLSQGGKENQRGIDFYNTVIGGIAEEEGGKNLRGINQFLNLYWQQHPDFARQNKRIKMIPLFKQILSDCSSLSFKIENIDSDIELKAVITEFAEKLENKNNEEKKSVLDICDDLFNSISEQNLNEIYVNRKDINGISHILTGDWSWLQSRMNAYADEVYTNRNEKRRWQKSIDGDEGENRFNGNYSLEELNQVLQYSSENVAETDIRITDYFEHRNRFNYDKETGIFKQGDELVALSIKESCEDIIVKHKTMNEAFTNISATDLLRDKPKDVEKIKNYLDSVQNLLHRIKLLKVNVIGDSAFYSVFDIVYNSLNEVVYLYNKTRNYITKKVISQEKFKLKFGSPTCANGWALNNEIMYGSIILKKDDRFFLGIMDRNHHSVFKNIPPAEKDEDFYEKMIYLQVADPTKDVPNLLVINGKTVKKNGRKKNGVNEELENLRNKYLPENINQIRKSKSYSKTSDNFSKDDLIEYIKYYKKLVKEYYASYEFHFKNPKDYSTFEDFMDDINSQAYQIKFIHIKSSFISNMVAEGKLYLFQIYNKDFAPGVSGMANMHTLYWKNLFCEENLKKVVLKLNGGAELFYRPAGIKEPIVHKAGSLLVNKHTEDGELIPESIYDEIYKNVNGKQNELSKGASEYKSTHKVIVKHAKSDIIKDKHYTEPKFLFHVPIMINFRAKGNSNSINEKVCRFLKNNPDVNIIGLDRGERHLIYLSLINQKGEILKQFSFNNVLREKNGQTIKVNYHEKLDQREKERDAARKSWQIIGKIAELKEGYLSSVIHQLTRLMVEYNAIIIMEDLNFGFKCGRFHVEKQVYQKFERMLIDKLNYLVFKDRSLKEAGGVLNGYQLAGKFESFQKLGKQSGMLFYVPAGYTSKIDPQTGFANIFSIKDLTNVYKKRDFFSRFEEIFFDGLTDSFVFTFNYEKFGGKIQERMQRTKWSVYSKDKRIVYSRKQKSYEDIDVTAKLKALFANAGINYQSGRNTFDDIMAIGADLENGAKPSKEIADFWDGLLYYFKLVLQMRNSNPHTGEDYIISPVMTDEGTFFDSREELKKGDYAKLPIDADANGAYHIALKGLSLLKRFDSAGENELEKINMKISNENWFKFVQEKDYAK